MSFTLAVSFLCSSMLFLGIAEASGLSCAKVFSQNETVPYQVTMPEVKNAMNEIDKAFNRKFSEIDELDVSDPYNAFFLPEGGFTGKKTWRGAASKMKLTQEQLDSSWQEPLLLEPTEISLYKGVLFPTAFYVRRVSLGGLDRAYPYTFSSYGKELPYAVLRGPEVEIHRNDGSKKIFDLWAKENTAADGSITLYRSANKSEYQLQVLIRHMKKLDSNQPAGDREISVLKQLAKRLGENGLNDAKASLEYILQSKDQAPRSELIAALLQSLGGTSGGVFTTPGLKAVKSFKGENDVIMSYKMTAAQLRQLLESNEIYVGIEFHYIEIAFIDNAQNQPAKNILIDSLTGVVP